MAVRDTLRRLERALIWQRAEFGVTALVDDLMQRLEDRRPAPSALEFCQSLVRAGLYMPAMAGVLFYLETCESLHRRPDRDKLLSLLLSRPWGGL